MWGSRWGLLLVSALILVIDLLTPPAWAVPVLYLFPLLLSSDLASGHFPWRWCAFFTALTVLGMVLPGLGPLSAETVVTRGLIVVILWALAAGLASQRRMRDQMSAAVAGRAEAEQQRSETEARYKQLVSEVRDYAIFRLDAKGHVETWNIGAERIKGYREAEILGAHFSCFYRPDERAAGRPDTLLSAAARNGRVEDEGWRIRKDGTPFFADVVITALRDETGRLTGYVKIVRDTTERNRLHEQFRLAVEAAPSGMVLVDEQGNMVLANTQIERMFGYAREELIGRSIETLVPEGLREAHRHARDLSMDDLQPRQLGVVQACSGKARNGTMIPLEIGLTPIRTQSGIRILASVVDLSERHRAEETRRALDERLRNILDTVEEVIWSTSIDMMEVFHVSPSALSVYGLTPRELMADPSLWFTVVHEDDRGLVTQAVERLHATGEFDVEYRIVRPDRSVRWLRNRGRIVRDVQGTPTRVDGLATDTTDRKQSEFELAQLNAELEERVRARTEQLANVNQELRESSRRFRAIFNSTYQFIGLLTPSGILLEANQSSLEFVGSSTGDALGRPFWDTRWWVHSTDAQARVRQAITEAARGDFVRFETTHRAHDGTLADFDFSLKPVFDEARTVVLLVAEGRDITERKRAAVAVERVRDELDIKVRERTATLSHVNARLEREVLDRRAAEQRLSQVVESAPSGMLLVDQGGIIRLINRKIEEQFGYVRDELIGRPVEQLVPASARTQHSGHRALFHARPEARPMGRGRVLHGLRKDGTEFPVEIGLSPMTTLHGQGVLASVVDITERQRLEEQLRRTERIAELGTLASGMAHEIGTPMNVILGRAEYLLQRTTDETLIKGLRTIVTQVERITKVMNQLLAFARRRSPERQAVDLRQTIDDSVEMFRERVSRKHIEVKTAYDPALPAVHADPDQMAQVLINLIMNSLQAMDDRGRLCITASRTDQHVELEVRDSGHGIPPEVLARIFDPFFTTKDTGEGTGLGLSVVKGIVEEHEGRIEISSEVNQGTTVKVLLPIQAMPLSST